MPILFISFLFFSISAFANEGVAEPEFLGLSIKMWLLIAVCIPVFVFAKKWTEKWEDKNR